MQKVTSKDTSINSEKLPAIFKKTPIDAISGYVLDYGCGKYTAHIKAFVESNGTAKYLPLDPFNQPASVNAESKSTAFLHKEKTYCVCSNVLNVIDDDDAIVSAIKSMLNMACQVYITVYEGDGKGTSRYTKNDCFQRNLKLRDYMQFIKKAGAAPRAEIKKGMIIIHNF